MKFVKRVEEIYGADARVISNILVTKKDDLTFIHEQVGTEITESLFAPREAAMLANISPRNDDGIVTCGGAHAKTIVEDLKKDAIVFGINTAPRFDPDTSPRLGTWLTGRLVDNRMLWAADPNNMLQKVGGMNLASQQDAFNLCNLVSAEVKLRRLQIRQNHLTALHLN